MEAGKAILHQTHLVRYVAKASDPISTLWENSKIHSPLTMAIFHIWDPHLWEKFKHMLEL